MISWLISFLVVLLVIAIVIIDVNIFKGKIFWIVIIAFALFMLTALVREMIFGG